jgi:16S rRNA processing protein RimM
VVLGHVSGVFGVRGEVRLHLVNRESALLAGGADVHLRDQQGRWYVARVTSRPGTNGRVLARFEGVDTREAAAAMQGVELAVDRSALPPLGPGEYYLTDLVGMEVRCGDEPMGVVTAVHDHGPVDVIELDGGRYVPSTDEHVEAIDLDARILFVKAGAVAV